MGNKQHPLFVTVAVVLIVAGAAMMLYRVTGERMSSRGGLMLLTGVCSLSVGSMLLTRSAIAIFFYGLFAASFLVLHALAAGLLHPVNLFPAAMLALIPALVKALPRKRR